MEKHRALIVDDEVDLAEVMEFDLQRSGYQTVVANGARLALEVLKSQSIDVVVSDLRMPDGDGLFLLKQVRQLYPHIPVVLFVSGSSDISIDEFYDLGAEALFSKPVNPDALCHVIEKALVRRENKWQRGQERLDICEPVHITVAGRKLATSQKTTNIGRGGLFIELNDDSGPMPRTGSSLEFSLVLEQVGGLKIEGSGVVRWCREQGQNQLPRGIGIEFESLSEASRAALIRTIHELKINAFIPRGRNQ